MKMTEKTFDVLLDVFFVRWIVGINSRHREQQLRIIFGEQETYSVEYTLKAKKAKA